MAADALRYWDAEIVKIVGIYRITLTRSDGSKANYVGQSHDVKQRLRSHRYELKHGSHPNRHMQAAWIKYQEASFEFSIVESAPSGNLTAREEHWIKELNARWESGGFNQRLVADSCFGLKRSPEAIAKSAEGNRGKSISQKHREAISAANKGRRPTDECIQKALEARKMLPPPMKGKHHTDSARLKVRQTKHNKFILSLGDNLNEPVKSISSGSRKNANSAKSHCKRGHEFTVENTMITTRGARQCRACSREYQIRYRGLSPLNTVTPEMLT